MPATNLESPEESFAATLLTLGLQAPVSAPFPALTPALSLAQLPGKILPAPGESLPPVGGPLPPPGGHLPPLGGPLPSLGGPLPSVGGSLPSVDGPLPPAGGPLPPAAGNSLSDRAMGTHVFGKQVWRAQASIPQLAKPSIELPVAPESTTPSREPQTQLGVVTPMRVPHGPAVGDAAQSVAHALSTLARNQGLSVAPEAHGTAPSDPGRKLTLAPVAAAAVDASQRSGGPVAATRPSNADAGALARSGKQGIAPVPKLEGILPAMPQANGEVMDRQNAQRQGAAVEAPKAVDLSAAHAKTSEPPAARTPLHAASNAPSNPPANPPTNTLTNALANTQLVMPSGSPTALGLPGQHAHLMDRDRLAGDSRQRIGATPVTNGSDAREPAAMAPVTDGLLSRSTAGEAEPVSAHISVPVTQLGGPEDAPLNAPSLRSADAPNPGSGRLPGAEGAMAEAAKLAAGDGQLPEQMVRRVLQAQAQNHNMLRIQLQPVELGHLDIQLQVNGERLNLTFTAQQAATRELLESYLPNLRQLLGETGIQLGDVDVRQHEQSTRQPTHKESAHRGAYDELPHTTDSDVVVRRHGSRHEGLIDAFA